MTDSEACGSDSPGGVDGLVPTTVTEDDGECKLLVKSGLVVPEGHDNHDNLNDDDDEDDDDNDIDKEGDEPEIVIKELNAEELLELSKTRLHEFPQAHTSSSEEEEQVVVTEEEEEEHLESHCNTEKDESTDTAINLAVEEETSNAKLNSRPVEDGSDVAGVVKDQSYYVELAMKKRKEEAKLSSPEDKNDNPSYLYKLAERKVAEAEAKAKADEETTGEHIIKPTLLPSKPTRNENSELWALLNYSKARLETGATPQVGKKTSSRGSSIRGDDTISVSSKLSKSSKRSQSSKLTNSTPVTVVGGPGDDKLLERPFPDVTDNGEATSVDGSVSLESATKNYGEDNDDDDASGSESSENANDDEEDEGDESSREEEDLPDFLKGDDDDEIDPEEARELYEAAKFKAASILSVKQDNLSDVQMLQAIAIAEDAAKNGEEKFSTKRSLFKLNEAKVEDLKNLFSLSYNQADTEHDIVTPKVRERYTGSWGIGGGRLIKKLGAVVQDFKEKCDEIDAKKEKERVGQPTGKDILNAAMLDLRSQIEEYEKIVTRTGKR